MGLDTRAGRSFAGSGVPQDYGAASSAYTNDSPKDQHEPRTGGPEFRSLDSNKTEERS